MSCKLFEHIVCKHILGHLEDHEILTNLQHGFRSGRSCETQLITTFHDIASAYNKKGSQIDIAVLDFSKAFDTVPHDGLLSKVKHYGIDDKILLWIANFLKQRKQRVVVDGIQSDLVTAQETLVFRYGSVVQTTSTDRLKVDRTAESNRIHIFGNDSDQGKWIQILQIFKPFFDTTFLLKS